MKILYAALASCPLLAGCLPAADRRPPSPFDPANPDAVGPAMPASMPATSPATAATLPSATYTCPMHPSVVRATPGECPQCGMALEAAGPGGTHVGH